MKEYKTIQTVDLGSGKIGLSDEQAQPRAGKLKKLKTEKKLSSSIKGVPHKEIYEIQAPVQFKRGEIIWLDDIPKNMVAFLEPVKKPEPEKDPDK